MQCIPLENASPGMVLSQAIVSPEGKVIAGEGSTLTKATIVRVRLAGVDTICVVSPQEKSCVVADIATIAQNLNSSFGRYTENVFMMTLRNMLAQYFAHKLAARQAQEVAASGQQEAHSCDAGENHEA